MLKLVLLALMSLNAFASDSLLEKFSQSGLIQPEDSFTYKCVVHTNGHVSISKRNGLSQPVSSSKHLSYWRLRELEVMIHLAERGQIEERGVMCDGGDRLLYGFHHGRQFILDENRDCQGHKVNRSRVMPRLKRLAKKICSF